MRRSWRRVKIRRPAATRPGAGRHPESVRRSTLAAAEWPSYDSGRIPFTNRGPDLGLDPTPTLATTPRRQLDECAERLHRAVRAIATLPIGDRIRVLRALGEG